MSTSNPSKPQTQAASSKSVEPALLDATTRSCADYQAQHFDWTVVSANPDKPKANIGCITLNRPERKNPLTFESYAELRDFLSALRYADDIQALVITGAGDNFCSGGDVHEIIGPLIDLPAPQLLAFTRMTGALVNAMRTCPQPIIAAVDGVCAGAGAIIAMASDLRLGTERSKTAFLFNRVGLAGCDMGACALLPRIMGQGRASELLYTGRSMGGLEGERWGFFNRLAAPQELKQQAIDWACAIADGPSFANGMTKTMLHQEWNMSIEQALEAEAQAQALCMLSQDFGRAYRAFVDKQRPVFQGN